MFKSIDELKDLTKKHTEYRGRSLNLIAAENLVSKTVRWYLTTDFGHRYNTFFDDPMKRNYFGQKYIALVETKARETAQELFGCKHVELRPLGGQSAGDAVIMALTKPGDVVFETPEDGGFCGHTVCTRLVQTNLITCHHANRVASLGAALIEMLEFGEAYHGQIIKNSQALGKALYDLGFKALYPEFNFSRSHVVLVDVKEISNGSEAASLLEDANIILGATTTPIDAERGTKNNGLRIGTQEITRAGMKEKDMSEIAVFFKRTLMDKDNPKEVARDIEKFTAQFNRIHYTWDEETPAYGIIENF